MTILVTGATGFVGRELCRTWVATGCRVRAAVRAISADTALAGTQQVIVPAIDADTDWSQALQGVEVVVHLAARVHVMHDVAANPLAEFRRTNTAGTERLAVMAAEAGARRLIFISTVKVNGESTAPGTCFSAADIPRPDDPYGISKWEAEQLLLQIAFRTGLEIGIVRPVLVYGPGVKGNFMRLISMVDRGLPFPAGLTENRRSMVYLGNLVSALMRCAVYPAAAGRTLLVGDGEDISTTELVRRIASALGRVPRLCPAPIWLMQLTAGITGRSAMFDRLAGSLCIDHAEIRRELDWTPPYTLTQGLAETAAWFRRQG